MRLGALDLGPYPALVRLLETQLDVWPEHHDQLVKSLAPREVSLLATSEEAAALVLRIVEAGPGTLAEACRDYRFVCETLILEEELYFRRHRRYRLSRFAEAEREVYARPELMRRYMNGQLLSNVFWINHARTLAHYRNRFLPANRDGYDHLEVGPGHGLWLAFAARDPRCRRVQAWDVSPGSVAAAGDALAALAIDERVELARRDVLDAPPGDDAFDSIVASEVLEHLEQPDRALANLRECLAPGGRLLVNVPANSPAPDHLYLLREPEEAAALVAAAGLEVTGSHAFPMTGYTLEQCRQHRLTISCLVIARRPSLRS